MDTDGPLELGRTLEVVIELPKGTRTRRGLDGRLLFASPVGAPFNYGSVPGHHSEDGDELDAIVLGPRLAVGVMVTGTVLGVVDFVDDGAFDPKVIIGDELSEADRMAVRLFFAVYAPAKRVLAVLRGSRQPTRVRGIAWRAR